MAATRRSLPLTDLSEDERTSARSCASFAEEKVRPLVAQDGRGVEDPARADRRLLRARHHGRRDPGAVRRRRRDVLHVGPRGRGAGARRPLGGRAGGRPEHARQQRDPALGDRGPEGDATSRSWPSKWVGAYALSEAGSGSDAFALACRAERQGRPLRADRPQALDHERRRGRAVHRDGERRPPEGLQGDHELPRREDVPRLHGGQEGGQARHPRLVHLRARSSRAAGCRRRTCSASRARATRSRSRRSTRAASGSAPRWSGLAQGAFEHALKYSQERQQFGKPIAEFQARAVPARRDGDRRSRPRGC